jgi:ATP-dependent DNA ligase
VAPVVAPWRRFVSVDFDPSEQRWRVRWRENGKQRSRRFATEADAVAFDEQRAALKREPLPRATASPTAEGDAINSYETKAGQRHARSLNASLGFSEMPGTAAAREPLPRFIEPMLLRSGLPPLQETGRWALELKWDGMRAQLCGVVAVQ